MFLFSGAVPVACLNSCLHANAKGSGCLFYKVAGRIGVYGLMVSLNLIFISSVAYLRRLF